MSNSGMVAITITYRRALNRTLKYSAKLPVTIATSYTLSVVIKLIIIV